jgi:hypothetical protein
LLRQSEEQAKFSQWLLFTLTERQHYEEEDYQKLVKCLYTLDQWIFTNHDSLAHNKKWEAICQSLDVKPVYTDFMGNKWVSEDALSHIAVKLYHNRHAFLQYVEHAERVRKQSDEIEVKHPMP